ncbi:MAG: VF530 family protein [Bacteroidia bacterium]|nr:VF530 family protein [Bacteroidia bacterium]
MDKNNKDPLHGVTLKMIVEALYEYYGWEALGFQINIRCFNFEPSVKSSLTFLRKTPWARAKVEALYLTMIEMQKEENQ